MGTILLVLSILGVAYGLVGIVLNLVTKKLVADYQRNQQPAGGVHDRRPPRPRLIDLPFHLAIFIVSSVVVFLFSVIVKVGAQDVGVLCTPTGVRDAELNTGWHFVAPWNSVNIMDKTVWVYTCANSEKEGAKPNADAIWAPTKDGIKVGFDISVSWRINPNEASWIYQNVTDNDGGSDGKYIWLEENVIRTKLKSALALTIANYTPIEVYSTKRGEIQQQIYNRMQKESIAYKLLIEQIDLREVYYNSDYEKAINAKKLAEQEVLRLIEVTKQKTEQLIQSKIDKDIDIQKAEGQAKALQIKGASIASNPKIIELEWINAWDGKLPVYMMGSGQGVMLNLNNK